MIKMDITRDQLEAVIDNTIILQTHAARNRAILKRRLIDGLTHEELAEEFDLSVQQIRKVIYKYEQVIFKHFS